MTTASPVVDAHAHFLPTSAREAARAGASWFGAEFHLAGDGTPAFTDRGKTLAFKGPRHMDDATRRGEEIAALGIDVQVLSLVPPLFRPHLDGDLAVSMHRAANDDIAAFVQDGAGRFLAMASLPVADPRAAVAELTRIAAIPGFVGVQLGTNVSGRDWSDPALFPILEAAAELRLLVTLHPDAVRAAPFLPDYYLSNVIGNPLETTIAAASLIFSGVLDRLPSLRVLLCHGGGYLGTAAGRMDHGRTVRRENADTSLRLPSEYLSRLLVDSITHDPALLPVLLRSHGAENVVLGTDFPADMGPVDPVGEIRGNGLLSPDEQAAILGGNILRAIDETGRTPTP